MNPQTLTNEHLNSREELDPLQKTTIYIAPGENFCNVYSMPYGMRPHQSPDDLAQRYKDQWRHIGRLNSRLEITYLDLPFQPFKEDIQGQMGGSFFEVPMKAVVQGVAKGERSCRFFACAQESELAYTGEILIQVGSEANGVKDSLSFLKISGLLPNPRVSPTEARDLHMDFLVKKPDQGGLVLPKSRNDFLEIDGEFGSFDTEGRAQNLVRDLSEWLSLQRDGLSEQEIDNLSNLLASKVAQVNQWIDDSDQRLRNESSQEDLELGSIYRSGKSLDSDEDLTESSHYLAIGLKEQGRTDAFIREALDAHKRGYQDGLSERAIPPHP